MLITRTLRLLLIPMATVLLPSCVYYNGSYDDDGWFGRDTLRGSGNSVTEIRPVSGIRTVSLHNQGDLVIEIGDTESLVVEAEDNLMPYIRTEVRGGELRISTEGRQWIRNREPIRYTLVVKSLEGIEAGSTGSINAPDLQADYFEIDINSTGNIAMGTLTAKDVEINVSSTGDAMLRGLQATNLDARISSTGHISIRSGHADFQQVRISSTGNFEAMDLDSNVAELRLSSTGSAYVSVNDYLEADLNSTGSVHYRGDARTSIDRNSVGRAVFVSRR